VTCKQVTTIVALISALTGALLLATAATAAGEHKNNAPFTRVIGGRTHALLQTRGRAESLGEPKNEAPFTRPGEPTAAVPDVFERYASAHPYGLGLGAASFATPTTVAASQSFRWGDAGLGASAGAAAILLLVASRLFLRSRRQPHTPQTAGS
jgi:hypothetical protein